MEKVVYKTLIILALSAAGGGYSGNVVRMIPGPVHLVT